MFPKKSIVVLFFVLLAVLLMTSSVAARPLADALGTGFTYQGRLTDGGSPANGTYDFQFSLYNAVSGGTQVGSTLTQTGVTVSNGLFTVQLDFGNIFDGTALYLQVAVRPGGSSGSYTALTPLQPLSATPYALYTAQTGNADRLDSQHGSFYQNAGNLNAGTLGNSFFDAYANLVAKGYLGNAAGELALNNGTLQATLNADLLDGLEASAFAPASHNHWGQTWTGSGNTTGLTLSGGATGLSGSGSTYGVYGYSYDGSGVYGYANVNGTAGSFVGGTGIFSQSSVPGQKAIWGYASGGSGNYAGYFDGNVQINGSLGITSNTLVSNLNTDLLDGHHASNSSGNVPLNNSTLNTNLNADQLDGLHASAFQQHYQNVRVVAKSGGDYTSINAALGSISDANSTNPYLIYVAPGLYSEQVMMKPYVDIQGSGELTTRISWTGSSSSNTGTVVGASNAELRFLTVQNTGGNTFAIALYNSGTAPRLTHITASALGGTTSNYGVYNSSSSPVMTSLTASALGISNNYGVWNDSSSPTIQDSAISASGGSINDGVHNEAASAPTTVKIINSVITGGGSTIYNFSSNYTVQLGSSQLIGGGVQGAGTYTCAFSYNGSFVALSNTCH